MSQSVNAIFDLAVANNAITQTTAQNVVDQIDAIALNGCVGINPNDLDSEEITLVSVVIDASGSMSEHRADVIKEYNESFLSAIQGAKNADSILISSWTFSSIQNPKVKLIHSWMPAPQCKQLTENDYFPDGGTPLNDAVMKALTGIFAYGQTLTDNGSRVKHIVLVISDGQENDSRISQSKVATFSKELLRMENFVLSYIFLGDENEGDRFAAEIGFPAQHRLTEDIRKSGKSGIRRLFGTVSSSVISKSQSQISSGSLSGNSFFGNP